jgi:hypothetical protein
MPVATVKNGTLCFSYEDSGPLNGSYTTLVMVHGTGFHNGEQGSVVAGYFSHAHTNTLAGIFGPMIPFAAANRVRLILVNRRDYPGSTPLSDAELAALGSSHLETRAKALAQQGTDIGLFLAWLVREEKIPAMSIDWSGRQQGGIVLVAWSLAHTPLTGFLAHADTLPADALRTLEPCLRAYCIFGEHTFGPRTASQPSFRPRRRAARLVRAPDPQQVPPARGPNVPDGRARAALLFVGVDVLHTLGARAQVAQPRAARHRATSVPNTAVRAHRDARRDSSRRARGRLVARPHPGLRGAASRHAARPCARADAPHAAGPGGGTHTAAVQGRRRVGREHALGDGRCRVGGREAVQRTRSDGAGRAGARGRGDARCESLRTFLQISTAPPARGGVCVSSAADRDTCSHIGTTPTQ